MLNWHRRRIFSTVFKSSPRLDFIGWSYKRVQQCAETKAYTSAPRHRLLGLNNSQIYFVTDTLIFHGNFHIFFLCWTFLICTIYLQIPWVNQSTEVPAHLQRFPSLKFPSELPMHESIAIHLSHRSLRNKDIPHSGRMFSFSRTSPNRIVGIHKIDSSFPSHACEAQFQVRPLTDINCKLCQRSVRELVFS